MHIFVLLNHVVDVFSFHRQLNTTDNQGEYVEVRPCFFLLWQEVI